MTGELWRQGNLINSIWSLVLSFSCLCFIHITIFNLTATSLDCSSFYCWSWARPKLSIITSSVDRCNARVLKQAILSSVLSKSLLNVHIGDFRLAARVIAWKSLSMRLNLLWMLHTAWVCHGFLTELGLLVTTWRSNIWEGGKGLDRLHLFVRYNLLCFWMLWSSNLRFHRFYRIFFLYDIIFWLN